MIEVRDLTNIQGKVFNVAVVRVLLNENYFAGAYGFENAICNGCFSRTGAAANADDQLWNPFLSVP